MNPNTYIHPREQLAISMSWIYRHHLTTAASGNISCLDENGDMWITPADVDKGSLLPRDMVCVQADGSCIGRYKPSSEYPLHRAIYDARPDIRAIVHAHPPCGVAFSVAKRTPSGRLFPQTFRCSRNIGFAPYAKPGSEKLATFVAEKFIAGCDSIILESHGICCGGATLNEAFFRFDTLEFSAQAEIRASMIGKPHELTNEQLLLDRTRARGFFGVLAPTNHAKPPHVINGAESICTYLKRGIEQGLFSATTGIISLRLGPDSFLINKQNADRSQIRPSDFVVINKGCVEQGCLPSHMAMIHDAIYKSHPDISCIINASPLYCLAHSICHRPIDTKILPESYLHLHEIPLVPYEAPYRRHELIVEKISLANPAVEICNNGIMTVGRGISDAYRALETVESTAQAVVSSTPLGGYVPLPPAQIAELLDPETP